MFKKMDGSSGIRKASPDDVERIRAVAHAAYGKYVARIGREPVPMVADFAALIAAGLVVVAEDRDGIKGYMVSWPEADAYYIDNIAVDPEHQGKGLGRHLIEHAATEAKRLRLPAVRLHTNVAMTENLAIYARIGFVETHRGTATVSIASICAGTWTIRGRRPSAGYCQRLQIVRFVTAITS